MKSTVTCTIAAVALAITGASSQAATNIARLQDISFTITSLDPSGGVDSAFLPGEAMSQIYGVIDGYRPGGPGDVTDGFLTAWDVDIPYGEMPNAGGSASMSESGVIVVEADATAPGTAYMDGNSAGDGLLTPYTSFTLTANAVLQALGGSGSEGASVCLNFVCAAYQSFTGGTQTRSFSVTYSNDTAQIVDVPFSVDAFAFASGVPEVPTSVLFLVASALFVRRPRKGQVSRIERL